MPKIVNQRMDIINALENNPRNYFVDTAGLKKLVADIFNKRPIYIVGLFMLDINHSHLNTL